MTKGRALGEDLEVAAEAEDRVLKVDVGISLCAIDAIL